MFHAALSDGIAVFVKDYVSSLSMPDRHSPPRSGPIQSKSSVNRKGIQKSWLI